MKKYLIFTFTLLFSICSNANLALVKDKDGSANVRAQPSLQGKVISQIKNNELIYCLETSTRDFCDIQTANGLEGYIHRSRISLLEKDNNWEFNRSIDDRAEFVRQNNKISIFVEKVKFDQKKFSVVQKSDQPILMYLNNQVWGTDNIIPLSEMLKLKHIKGILNGYPFNIVATDFAEFVFPNTPLHSEDLNDHEQLEIYRNGEDIYLFFQLSVGGAAQYGLVFKINKGKLQQQWVWLMAI